jgi:hypothetical protein
VAGPSRPRPDDLDPDGVPREITGLVIPVPEAQPFAVHPHVTLLAPFGSRARVDDPRLHTDLLAFFGAVAAFDFALVEVRKFPAGFFYLAPEPAGRFRDLTDALAARYPEFPPYEGQFTDVIPHLTLDEDAHPEPLPIRAHASAAQLVHSNADVWTVVRNFPLDR